MATGSPASRSTRTGGFETLTATTEGLVDHTDSQGNAGRYGQGDLQWMTAGAGIVHGEMFPLINKDQPNTLRLFQIWLNLPAASKFAEPAFVMHWNERVPRVSAPGSEVRVFAGQLGDAKGLPPPPSSWAASSSSPALPPVQSGHVSSIPPH